MIARCCPSKNSICHFFCPEGLPSEKVVYSLFFYTIVGHILLWFCMELTSGSLWIYGTRSFPQYQLFEPGLDGGYFEHFQYILLFWCALLSTFIWLGKQYGGLVALLYWFLFAHDSLSLIDAAQTTLTGPLFRLTGLGSGILRVKDFQEYIYWLINIGTWGPLLLLDLRNSLKEKRCYLRKNIGLLCALSFFSIFIDTLNANFTRWSSEYSSFLITKLASYSLYLLEECGEIWLIAIMCVSLLKYCSMPTKRLEN